MRTRILLLISLTAIVSLSAQNVGDEATAGFDNGRTGLNPNMGSFGPPLGHLETIPLPGVLNAQTFLAFEDNLVVGEVDTAGSTVRYHLFEVAGGTATLLFNTTFLGSSDTLDYVPAFAGDIVLLGGPATSTVKAVEVSTASLLWEDATIGGTTGRYPIMTSDLALYHGETKVTAADADSGVVLWEVATTTAQAPLAMHGTTFYFLDQAGNLHSRDVRDGSLNWMSPGGADGASFVATEKYLHFSTAGGVGALDARTGAGVWSAGAPGLASNPGIALGYDRLFVFQNDNAGDGSGTAGVRAYDPDTGEMFWEITEEAQGAEHAFLANGVLYYYNSGAARIRARDALTGVLLWSIQETDVRDLAASHGILYVLGGTDVDAYGAVNQTFFAQMADGGGQSTLVALTSLSDATVAGTLRFFDVDGDPLSLEVDGIIGSTSTVPFTIGPRASRRIQTKGSVDVQVGWIRVDTDGPIRGTSIFQFSDAGVIFFEAGVGQANPVGEAVIYTLLEEGPNPQGGTLIRSTGVAIADPFDEGANVTISLRDAAGVVVAEVDFLLDPGAQIARFVEELFPDFINGLPDPDFEGSMVVSADIPIIVTALRTQAGIQISSFPAGQIR